MYREAMGMSTSHNTKNVGRLITYLTYLTKLTKAMGRSITHTEKLGAGSLHISENLWACQMLITKTMDRSSSHNRNNGQFY